MSAGPMGALWRMKTGCKSSARTRKLPTCAMTRAVLLTPQRQRRPMRERFCENEALFHRICLYVLRLHHNLSLDVSDSLALRNRDTALSSLFTIRRPHVRHQSRPWKHSHCPERLSDHEAWMG